MASKSKRDQVIALVQAGLRNKNVANKLNTCPKNVHATMKRSTHTEDATLTVNFGI